MKTTHRFVGYDVIRRRFAWGTSRLLRLVVLGEVRALVQPGRAIRYSLADVERIAAETKPARRGFAKAV